MKVKLSFVFFLVISSTFLFAQETYVPDDNFEAFLEANGMGNGIPSDDYVTTSAIQSTTVLAINNQGISDLTGLQDFSSLTTINCSNNNLTSLDLSFKRIFNVFASNNNLVEVNIKNGHNFDVNSFDVTNNPSLTCIQVDDETQSYYSSWTVDSGVTFKNYCELTAVTDSNFENYLETHDANGNVVLVGDLNSLGNGITSDGFVATEKIAVVTSLNISSSMIADITGIEDFTALEVLDFSNNGVGNFDLSNNIALKELYCATNGMSSINVAANVNLEVLNCSDNSNTTIDVSTNVKLKELNISTNGTTSLNLGSVSTLEIINASNNNLTTIDLSNLSNLTDLNCDTNYTLDVTDFSPLTSLVNLNFSNTNLRSLNLSSNTLLETLTIDFMSGFYLDLSSNTALTSFSANSSDLNSLNIKNGNNANITSFDARFNQFTCIAVDDPTASYLSTWQKDNKASFESDCSTTNILDTNFEYHLENHDADGNVVSVGSPNSMGNGILNDGKVFTSRIENVTYLNISSNSIDELDGLEAFESLEILDCSENNFNEFDFSQLPELKELYIHDLFFAVLNLSSNLKIEKLIYNNANSTTLNLGNNTVIKELNIGGNNITSFDVSAYTTLEVLNIDDNYQILPLNVRPLANLTDLSANDTSLQNLDVSQNLLLEKLSMDRASGFYLDLSNNTALTSFSARTSDMSGINIQNGNNANITLFDTEQNHSTLFCIQVDDPTASYLNTWNTDSEATFRLDCGETTVPDDNFENYLETHDADGNVVSVGDASSMGNGIANDNKVYTSNISSVEELDIDNLSISDLTGIGGFVALKTLYCHDNTIENIDLSQNVALERLDCYKSGVKSLNISQNTELTLIQCFRNELTSLDVSNNTKLTRIDVFNNQITTLDLSQNLELTSINCARNQLNSLDVSNNVKLTDLTCYENNITSLDVTMLPLLEDLDCVGNGLMSLDLSQNPELVELQVYENNLTSLDVSNNLKLVELFAESNSITSLDVSKNTVLEDLSIAFNQLTYLNIRNGNNTNLNPNDFDIRNNPGLTCVTVDDVTYANATFPRKDAQTEYKLFCTETDIPDDNFEAYLETHNATGGIVPVGDPTSMGNGIANDDKVATEKIQNITSLNISNQGITDVTGLEDFTSLEQLRAFSNVITSGSLDLTVNTNLTEIYCSDMGLNTVDVSGLTKLVRLEFRNNNLSSIDVSSNSNLNYFNIDGNNFTGVNVSANILLSDLRIRDNVVLNSINISNNNNLIRLYVGGNSLTTLDVSNNTLLETISAGENQLATINVTGLNNLTDLFLEDMPTLTSLDVSSNTNLEDIGVSGTGLSVLDLSPLTKLIEVYANNTTITELDFSASPNLEYVECQNSQLTSLNLKNGNNSSDIELYATGNANLFCIQVDDPSATYLSGWEKDATANFSDDCNWTYIPDDRFEDYLETHDANNNFVAVGDPTSMGNGIANDNFVKTANIENVTDLFIGFQGVTDITGLEAFSALEVAFLFNNTLTDTDLDLTANTNLKRIEGSGMGLTSINITGLAALERLEVSRNNLTSIDLSTNTALKDLIISTNNLSGLDISANVLLEDLQIHETTLSSIDVSANVNLTRILASLNQFTSLNTQNNALLETLSIGRNPLSSYDVSHLTNLQDLNLDETNITSIDISKNTNLVEFSARDIDELVELNARNGNNNNFTEFEVDGCPNLTCIEVDDPTASYLVAPVWLKDATANFSEYCRFTTIPDANFEAYLETHNEFGGSVALGSSNSLGNGIIDDNLVPTAKIEVIQLLTPRNEGIEDFTGIEDFKSLIRFWADDNTLTNTDLDLRNNILLESLTLENTGITSLNINGLTVLEGVEAGNNSLTTIDVSTNTGLKFLNVGDNDLTSLDISNNDLTSLTVRNNRLGAIDISTQANLTSLYAENTNITSLDVSNNSLLENLECGVNPLTTLDVTNLTDLFFLSFSTTSISEIDLSNNINLSRLECDSTPLTSLDLGKQNTLDNLSCKNSLLTNLNLRSGNNADLDNVDVTGNPSLSCISVDDPAAAALLGTWLKDATANYAEYCRMTYVPDDAFETFLENNGYGNGVMDDYVYTALVEVSEGFNLHNGLVEDMTGIEDFRDMWFLGCRSNSNLTSIDLSKNTKLTVITLANNNLASLDLSNNVLLEQVYLDGNPNLGDVDISNLAALTNLSLSNTGINSVDISANPLVRQLILNDNNFIELDISMYPNIVQLRIANNQLTSLNVANGNNDNFTWFDGQGNPGLTCIKADKEVQLYPDIWEKDATASFALYCDLTYIADANFENYLETHDADGNLVTHGDATSLGNGIANDNQVYTEKIETVVDLDLSSLNITDLTGIEAFAALEILNLDYNDLTTLDLSSNSNLRILDVAENDLTELDLSVIPTLEEVELRSNKIRTLTVNNPNLKVLRASKNQYTSLDVTNCPQLEELGVTQTLLATLDVRNGNNGIMTDFNAKFNDYLTCIEVDDATASYLSTWDKDATANFTEDCNTAVWSGTNGTDWTDNGNWSSNAVAVTSQNVIVPVFVTSPVIASGVTAEMNDLEIQELSSFTVEDNGVAIVNGNFNTTETASIKSSSTTSGTLIVKGTSNGMVTFERSGLEANKWSIVTAPVSGQSIKEFIENATNDIRVNTTVTPNRYAVAHYDDSNADGSKWVYYTADDIITNTLTFEKGKSYIVSRATSGSVTFTGTLETNDVSVSVNEDQWNAVGSPYTAYLPINNNSNNNFIQENLSKFNPENVGVYVWDNSQNKYVAKTLLDTDTSLTVGQGFFVKTATGISSINFKEDQRLSDATGVQTFSRSTAVPNIEIKAEQEGKIVDTNIKFFSTTTKGLDPGYDIGNFGGSSFDVYTHLIEDSIGNDFTIQSLSDSDLENTIIPLGITTIANKEVKISVQTENLPEGTKVYLEDTETGDFVQLDGGEVFSFRTDSDIEGIGRFYIHTKAKTLGTDDVSNLSDIRIFKSNKQEVTISGIQSREEVSVQIYSVLGSEVYSESMLGTSKLIIQPETLEVGVYIVRLEIEGKIINKKVIFE
ncbi:T9SS type A sorting domain-containing protein [Tenacibaculum sp. 190524A05c]|uniref:T9SS type A sorting domain-containing protein n=1 Tax=Tenacibaculum platacis TaxID=3137852 RepID=UPI0031FA80B4